MSGEILKYFVFYYTLNVLYFYIFVSSPLVPESVTIRKLVFWGAIYVFTRHAKIYNNTLICQIGSIYRDVLEC